MKNNIKQMVIGFLTLTTMTLGLAQEHKVSLSEALMLAKENNKSLKVHYLEEKFAEESIKVSKGNLLPSLSANGNYSYYFDRQVIFMPGSFVGSETDPVVDVAVGGRNTFSTSISLHQPIVSEAARRQVKSAKIEKAQQGQMTLDHKARLTVLLTSTYLKALLIRESLNLNQQSLERNLRSLDDSRSLLRQGKSLKIDTLRNFIAVENLGTTVTYLESQYEVTLLQLKQIMGLQQDDVLVLTDNLEHDNSIQYFEPYHVVDEILSNRPDLQWRKLTVELNKSLMSQSQAQRLPTVSVVGSYQLQAQSDNRQFDAYRWPRTSFLGLQANVPIFTGNKINSRIRQSSLRTQASELELLDAMENAKTEVAGLESKLKEVLQRLTVFERTVEAAEMNYRIVNDRYKNGLSSRLEITDAELSLTEAKMNQLHAVYNVRMAKLEMDKALGLLAN
ncbi:MAG: TolC family protein [Cyclobacteriaceae bacterium]